MAKTGGTPLNEKHEIQEIRKSLVGDRERNMYIAEGEGGREGETLLYLSWFIYFFFFFLFFGPLLTAPQWAAFLSKQQPPPPPPPLHNNCGRLHFWQEFTHPAVLNSCMTHSEFIFWVCVLNTTLFCLVRTETRSSVCLMILFSKTGSLSIKRKSGKEKSLCQLNYR